MKILCYGDSNTWGYDGTDPFGARLPENARWPELLGRSLGCECLNLGLNGRRVPRYPRTVEADLRLLRRGRAGDLILVMLGTNDVLLGAESEDTAAQMARFLKALKEALPGCTLLLCAPPPVTVEGKDFTPVFAELASAYEALARELGVLFADTAPWDIPTVGDGVHFSARGHVLFALKMGQTLRALLPG